MLKIERFTCENLPSGCVTDEKSPRFSFAVSSEREGATLKNARLRVGSWSVDTTEQIGIAYAGKALQPFTVYEASLEVSDDACSTAGCSLTFEPGRMDTPWQGTWITDATYRFTEKKKFSRRLIQLFICAL